MKSTWPPPSSIVVLNEVIDTFPARKVKTTIHLQDSGLYIEPEGYSDHGTADEFDSSIVILEVHEGRLRVLIWSDINEEEPTHTIDLEGARRSARKDYEPLIVCHICSSPIDASTAHRHQEGWVGECCWDERLRSSE